MYIRIYRKLFAETRGNTNNATRFRIPFFSRIEYEIIVDSLNEKKKEKKKSIIPLPLFLTFDSLSSRETHTEKRDTYIPFPDWTLGSISLDLLQRGKGWNRVAFSSVFQQFPLPLPPSLPPSLSLSFSPLRGLIKISSVPPINQRCSMRRTAS